MSTFAPSPALLSLRNWARDKQTEIAVPLTERSLWKQIADEIDAYTGASTDEPALDGPDLFAHDASP